MKECDIFRGGVGVKTYSDTSYIIFRVKRAPTSITSLVMRRWFGDQRSKIKGHSSRKFSAVAFHLLRYLVLICCLFVCNDSSRNCGRGENDKGENEQTAPGDEHEAVPEEAGKRRRGRKRRRRYDDFADDQSSRASRSAGVVGLPGTCLAVVAGRWKVNASRQSAVCGHQ